MEYVVHHVATLFLIVFSFMVGHFRIGILILVYLSLSLSLSFTHTLCPPPHLPTVLVHLLDSGKVP